MRLISDSAHTADQEACPDCGLAYVRDSPSDQRLHADIHDEVVNGASAPLVDVQRIVKKYAEFEILWRNQIWSFVYAKAKNVPIEFHGQFGYGDVWTCTAIDADTKLGHTASRAH